MLYFKAITNSIDFYKEIFLHVFPIGIIVPWSKILNLTTIFKESLVKAGGSLNSAEILVNNKHQIVVSKAHPIATLIIHKIHQRNTHVGREHTLSILRENIRYQLAGEL